MQCGLIIAAVLSALISIVATWRTDLAALRFDLSAELDMATTPIPLSKGRAVSPTWPSGSRGNQPGHESRPGHPTK